MTAPHWHAGFNVPGFLPESEPSCHHDPDQARALLMFDLRSFAEGLSCEDPDADDGVSDDCPCAGCGTYWAVQGELGELRYSDVTGGWDAVFGGYHWWITPVPAADCAPTAA